MQLENPRRKKDENETSGTDNNNPLSGKKDVADTDLV